MLRAYVVLKLLTGLRRGDLLRLKVSDLRENGIHVETSKTKKQIVITWTAELKEAVEAAIAARPKDLVPWIFCTRTGDCYVKADGSANGFDSLWQRFMLRAVAKTKLEYRFQEKDLRKKTASDMPLEHAKFLLGHVSQSTTAKHYRLLPAIVMPHSLKLRDR
jgi:integrase